MYRLFIPYIRTEAAKGNVEAIETLKEMTDTKVEWLEDLVLDKTKLKIGSKQIDLLVAQTNGYFAQNDINQYGYPENVKANGNTGDHYLWAPNENERAAIRGRGSELYLNLDWVPSDAGGVLGVRFAKFF